MDESLKKLLEELDILKSKLEELDKEKERLKKEFEERTKFKETYKSLSDFRKQVWEVEEKYFELSNETWNAYINCGKITDEIDDILYKLDE